MAHSEQRGQCSMATEKAVAKAGETGVALLNIPTREDLSIVTEAIGTGDKLSIDMLERAKMLAGGVTSFDVGNGDTERTLEGILILRHPTRVFWQQRFAQTGGGTPPDCSSLDMQVGKGDRGLPGDTEDMLHECDKCPLADWGSAVNDAGENTNGKACRQVTRMFMLQPDKSLLPMLITLPPSSYKKALTYTVQLSGQRKRYYAVMTKMTVKKASAKQANGASIDYGEAEFTRGRDLTEDELAMVQRYRDGILPFLNELTVVEVEAQEASL